MTTVLVEYVGQKKRVTDRFYGTGKVWDGPGDVQEVPAAAWERMSRHTDMFRLAEPVHVVDTGPGLADKQEPAPVKTSNRLAAYDLEGMNREQLGALAKQLGVTFSKFANAQRLREAILAWGA